MTTTRAGALMLRDLIDYRENGRYTLPEAVTSAYAVMDHIKALAAPAPEAQTIQSAASALVADAIAGRPTAISEYAEQVVAGVHGIALAEHAGRILTMAQEEATEHALHVTREHADIIISDHLAPAYTKLLEDIDAAADDIRGFGLDVRQLITAPAKARRAYADLTGPLQERHDALRNARSKVLGLADQTPASDVRGMFAELRRPHALAPWWSPESTATMPVPESPQEPAERLLWLVTTASSAQPWLPTIGQQEAAWKDVYGDGELQRQRNAHNMRALKAQMS